MALTVEEYRLSEYEEVLGVLHSVENTEIGLIAVVGNIAVLLPEELSEDLQGLIDNKIAILRLDGYHTRCLNKELHKALSQSAAQGVTVQV
jgi:hypothetical protein